MMLAPNTDGSTADEAGRLKTLVDRRPLRGSLLGVVSVWAVTGGVAPSSGSGTISESEKTLDSCCDFYDDKQKVLYYVCEIPCRNRI